MQTVNYERFAKTVTGDSVIDFGCFILGLIEIPTEVPEEYLLDEDFIQLGGGRSNSKSNATIYRCFKH